jgi:restriction system protein
MGTKLLRDFGEEMIADGIERGQLLSTGEFTTEARELADIKQIDLVTGAEFVKRVNALAAPERNALLEAVTAGDYTTPTCVKCDVKMVLRGEGEKPAWGCRNHPLCKATLTLRAGSN